MCISSGFESRIPLWRLTFSTFREFPRSLLIPCSHGHANWELSILLIGHFFAKDGRMEHQRVVTMFGDMILFFNAFFQCVYVFKNTRMIHIIMMYIYILYMYSNIYIAIGAVFVTLQKKTFNFLVAPKKHQTSFKSSKRVGEWYCLWWVGKTEIPAFAMAKSTKSVGFIGSLDLHLKATPNCGKNMSFRIKI